MVIGAVVVVQGIGSPETLSQTYDAVFHYNAIAYIVDSGNASSLTLNSLGTPGTPGSFYPSAWHDFASLLVLTTGASAPVRGQRADRRARRRGVAAELHGPDPAAGRPFDAGHPGPPA